MKGFDPADATGATDGDDARAYAAWSVPVLGLLGLVALSWSGLVDLAITPSFVVAYCGTVALAAAAGVLPTPFSPPRW